MQNLTTTSTTNQFYNIDVLCINNIDNLLRLFGIKYYRTPSRITMACPIHGGDNPGACTLFLDRPANWKCWTRHCENNQSSLFSFFRILYNKKFSKVLTTNQFKEWLVSNCKNKDNIKEIETISNVDEQSSFALPKNSIAKYLSNIPKEMISRGYSKEILLKHNVFNCYDIKKNMFQRTVVPIYDINNNWIIGCTGRSIFPECKTCKLHHDENKPCPTQNFDKAKCSKWRHSKGMKTKNILYNLWFAKKYIEETKTAVLVESPGNVWKLEQNGIYNSLGIFGSALGENQLILLESLPIKDLYLLFDNDAAGQKCTQETIDTLNRLYNIHVPNIDYYGYDDISKLSDEEIKIQLKELVCKEYY